MYELMVGNVLIFQPFKYLHMLRLLEAGLSTRAQDYTRVLAEHVTECVARDGPGDCAGLGQQHPAPRRDAEIPGEEINSAFP